MLWFIPMKTFTVLYQMPVAGLEAWGQKSEAERKEVETQMKHEWDTWLEAHKDLVKNTIGLGTTMRVSAAGVAPAKNGLMLSSYVMAESIEEVAAAFKDHPHLQIPEATIDIMEIKPLTV